MLRNDHILKLLQQLDKVLKKVAQLRLENEHEAAIRELQQSYISMLNLAAEEIPNKNVVAYLTQEKKLTLEQLNVLAELLKEEGDIYFEQGEEAKVQTKYELSLNIFEYLNQEEQLFSFEREAKITHMLARLSQSD